VIVKFLLPHAGQRWAGCSLERSKDSILFSFHLGAHFAYMIAVALNAELVPVEIAAVTKPAALTAGTHVLNRVPLRCGIALDIPNMAARAFAGRFFN
jgi:hypothetical protein